MCNCEIRNRYFNVIWVYCYFDILVDEKAVQDLLGNPQVKAALLDPDIIKLMELLKSNPSEAQRYSTCTSNNRSSTIPFYQGF